MIYRTKAGCYSKNLPVHFNTSAALVEMESPETRFAARRQGEVDWRWLMQTGRTLGRVGESGCGKSTLGREQFCLDRTDRRTGFILTKIWRASGARCQAAKNLQMIFRTRPRLAQSANDGRADYRQADTRF